MVKIKTIFYFNMIEVAMAVAVFAVGIAGIMSLFPVGVQAARDAIGDNYAAESADQMLHYLARYAIQNWAALIGTSAITGTIRETKVTDPSAVTKGASLGGDIYATSDNSVYIIQHGSGAVIDFDAHVKVWKSQVTCQTYINASTGWVNDPVLYTRAARINMEISWPIGKPYNVREKRVYCMDVFRQ
jgi:Tfp pilus assembly protein PilV